MKFKHFLIFVLFAWAVLFLPAGCSAAHSKSNAPQKGRDVLHWSVFITVFIQPDGTRRIPQLKWFQVACEDMDSRAVLGVINGQRVKWRNLNYNASLFTCTGPPEHTPEPKPKDSLRKV